MAELKRYTSFEALKLDQKPIILPHGNIIIAEFETFLKQLQNEYSNNKKPKTRKHFECIIQLWVLNHRV
jgi:hypothetical protein